MGSKCEWLLLNASFGGEATILPPPASSVLVFRGPVAISHGSV